MNSLRPILLCSLLAACQSSPDEAGRLAAPQPSADTPRNALPEREAPKEGIETLNFQIDIAAPVDTVWQAMLGAETYPEWTSAFMAGSYFEGTWAEGERMHFLAPGGSGMVAKIAALRPREVVSIKHLGFVMNGKEDTTSEGIQSWAPAYEIYRFASTPGGTRVSIEHDNLAQMVGYMEATWPKALTQLKELCEAGQ